MGHTTAVVLTAGHLVGAAATVGGLAAPYVRERVADAARSLKPQP
jgi:hypothetical protein